jgi:hypothetical protein
MAAMLIASLLASCASSQMVTYIFPGIQVVGDLTVDDVRQITQLAQSRRDIRKPIYEIYVRGPGRADVSGGRPEKSRDPVTGFKVQKDNGRWKIIGGSVYQTEVIITS